MSEEKKNTNKKKSTDNIREKAEEMLLKSDKKIQYIKLENHSETIHELQVHQIELEMQNEELRRIQLELEESGEKYIDLYDFAPVGYFTLTQTSIIKEANLISADLFGVVRKDLLNSRFRKFIFPEDIKKWDAFFTSLIEFEKKKSCELRIKRMDGSSFFAMLESIRVDLHNGDVVFRTAITDITERKLREEEIKNINKELKKTNSEKDKFFSILSHDLRSPFQGFLGFMELMSENLTTFSQEELKKMIGLMYNSANNLFQLLTNLFDWASFQRGVIYFNPALLSLNDVIKKCIDSNILFMSQKEISVETNVPVNTLVFCDVQMLESVVRNLLTNAIKFTNKQGKIKIFAEKKPDDLLEVCISDSGIGMEKELLDHLFELDFDIRRKGTDGEPSSGLGLLLCKEFVEKNSGKLYAKSEVGKGSDFYFTIPRKQIDLGKQTV